MNVIIHLLYPETFMSIFLSILYIDDDVFYTYVRLNLICADISRLTDTVPVETLLIVVLNRYMSTVVVLKYRLYHIFALLIHALIFTAIQIDIHAILSLKVNLLMSCNCALLVQFPRRKHSINDIVLALDSRP